MLKLKMNMLMRLYNYEFEFISFLKESWQVTCLFSFKGCRLEKKRVKKFANIDKPHN